MNRVAKSLASPDPPVGARLLFRSMGMVHPPTHTPSPQQSEDFDGAKFPREQVTVWYCTSRRSTPLVPGSGMRRGGYGRKRHHSASGGKIPITTKPRDRYLVTRLVNQALRRRSPPRRPVWARGKGVTGRVTRRGIDHGENIGFYRQRETLNHRQASRDGGMTGGKSCIVG